MIQGINLRKLELRTATSGLYCSVCKCIFLFIRLACPRKKNLSVIIRNHKLCCGIFTQQTEVFFVLMYVCVFGCLNGVERLEINNQQKTLYVSEGLRFSSSSTFNFCTTCFSFDSLPFITSNTEYRAVDTSSVAIHITSLVNTQR